MQYFPTLYQSVIFKSRYARWREDLGRREDWPETISRYFDFFQEHLLNKTGFKLKKDLRSELESYVLSLKVMPSMRCLMTAGPALERCNVAGYNCSYLPIDHPRAFDEILYALMCGTGVGFSVEHKDIDKLPVINEHFEQSSTIIVVDDSKQGWAKGFRELIAMLYAGQIPSWDLSKLRPAGAILKTFGGRSSGPDPLADLFNFTIDKFTKAAGRRLTPLECHDIVCKTGEVVVVGGVRRSALISLSNIDDRYMQESKSGRWWDLEPQRALANNSAVYSRTPDVATFMEEWVSLVKSQSGERGIFNRQAAIKQAAKNGRRDTNHRFGTNPCCVTGDTLILTDKGHLPIEELVDKDIKVWNGYVFSSTKPFYTGFRETVKVHLSDGTSLQCTPNHKFILDTGTKVFAEDLKHGDKLAKFAMPILEDGETYSVDAYSQGFYCGDGNTDLEYSWLYKPKYACQKRLIGVFGTEHNACERKTWRHGVMLPKSFVPINGNKTYCLNWLAGFIDSDGCAINHDNSTSIQISSINYSNLNSTRLMLNRLGCTPKINVMHEERITSIPNHVNGNSDYLCKKVWRLIINSTDVKTLIDNGLVLERVKLAKLSPNRSAKRFVRVLYIEDVEERHTYCFDEPQYHLGTFNGIVTGQSEIILRPYQYCNLTEVVVRADDTLETLKDKIRIATILGTFQSTLTDFKYLRKIWKDNTEEERLLGVSLTGIYDGPLFQDFELEEMKNVAIKTNKEYADILKIPVSTAITCVKPSGTVSQLVDAASGIHPRHSKFYIRTIRGDKKDPLTKFLIDAGIPAEDDVMKPKDTVVFSFPQKAPEEATTRKEIKSAIEHLEMWLMYQRHWCEHKPSVTISVKDNEWLDVAAWVYKHFDEMSGVSFLPYSDHTYKQAPYQECTVQEYEDMRLKMPQELDWSKLSELEDNTIATQELNCSAGGCEIK